MNFNNPPAESPQNVFHKTFYSQLINHEIGYNIYLPPDYDTAEKRYPVTYHLHGWQGNESSDIWVLEKIYRSRPAITVFVNATSGDNGYLDKELPMESIIITELVPHIDTLYRTDAARGGRSLSGFSMGGAGAFYYAVKYPGLFHSVTAYAGTYHHFYHEASGTVGAAPEKASMLLESMMKEKHYLEKSNILYFIRESADKIRGNLHIELHVGADDILLCDNEILHLYLNLWNIPHKYQIFLFFGHELEKIL